MSEANGGAVVSCAGLAKTYQGPAPVLGSEDSEDHDVPLNVR